MELIDKDALVAEIEKKIKQYKNERNTIIKNTDNLKELSSRIIMCQEIISFLDTLEVKEVDLEKKEEKLNKAIKLADAMYDAAQRLTTDASRLHKAMQDWWNFRNNRL